MDTQLCHFHFEKSSDKHSPKGENSAKMNTLEMQSAMDTELFTMPIGLDIEGMRAFIKECARK